MKQYSYKFKSDRMEEIVNKQMADLKGHLIELMSRTKNGRTIDYTQSIDINFEERRHQIIKQMAKLRRANYFSLKDYERMEKTLYRMSSVSFIDQDFRLFLKRARKKVDFDAFYLIPNIDHIHMLLVLYNGDVKHLINQARKRPYRWNVKSGEFNSNLDEYLENKVKYLMLEKNMNLKQYEEIIYDYYPNRDRIDTFFEQYQIMYDYTLQKMGNKLMRKLNRRFKLANS